MLFLLIALAAIFFVAPGLIGGLLGATVRTTKHAAKVGVNSTIEASQSVKQGYASSSEDVTASLKSNVSQLASRVQKWAETA